LFGGDNAGMDARIAAVAAAAVAVEGELCSALVAGVAAAAVATLCGLRFLSGFHCFPELVLCPQCIVAPLALDSPLPHTPMGLRTHLLTRQCFQTQYAENQEPASRVESVDRFLRL